MKQWNKHEIYHFVADEIYHQVQRGVFIDGGSSAEVEGKNPIRRGNETLRLKQKAKIKPTMN